MKQFLKELFTPIPSFELLIYHGGDHHVRRVLFSKVGESKKGEAIWTSTSMEYVQDFPGKAIP